MYKLLIDPSFLANLPSYCEHADFVNGKVSAVRKYLVRHMSEMSRQPVAGSTMTVGDLVWYLRNQRLSNDNLCDPVASHWLGYLSREMSQTGLDDPQLQMIFNDLDGEGTNLNLFARAWFWEFLKFGRVGILIESEAEIAVNRVQARLSNERCYARVISPIDIVRCARFTTGAYRGDISEAVIFEGADKDDKLTFRRFWIEAQGEPYQSQRIVTEKPCELYSKTSGLTDPVGLIKRFADPVDCIEDVALVGPFDEIPFDVVGEGVLESVIKDVVPANREHLNKKSARDSINYYQAFKRLAAFGVQPEEVSGWSESTIAIFQNEAAKIQEISAGDPTALTTDLETVKRDGILRGLMRYNLLHQLATGQVQSAESKREDNKSFEQYLDYIAEYADRQFQDLLYFICLFEFGAPPDPDSMNITMARDWGITKTDSEVAADNEMYNRAGDFGDAGHEVRKDLLIESIQAKPWDDARKQELVELIQGAKREPVFSPFNPFQPTNVDEDEETEEDTELEDDAKEKD